MDPTSEADNELHTQVRQQEVVAELGQQALETDDLDGLLHDASVAVAETLDAEYATILELLDCSDVRLRDGVGWRDDLVGSATMPADRDSQVGYTLHSEQPIVVDDRRTEERFSVPALLANHDVVSGISAVIGSVKDPWGILGAHATSHREFADHDANFVQRVANVLASAIENERTRREREQRFGRTAEHDEREQQLEQYHALTEAASDVIITIDEECTIQSVNPAVSDVFGYQPAELEGRSLTTLMSDEVGERHRDGLTQYLETGTRTLDWDYVELLGRHADGSNVPLAVSFSETEYEDERYFTGVVRDVTERTVRERELELFRTLLDHSTDSVFVIEPESGGIVDANETACRRRGYSRSEFLHLTVLDLETTLSDWEAWQSFIDDLEAQAQTTFDGEHRRKDGSTYPVEVNATYVELDREYVLAIARDVTERRKRESELRERERQLSTLMANVPGMVYRCRNERGWPMEFVSDACRDVTGYEPDALERGDVGWGDDVIVTDDRERIWEAVRRAVTEEETFSETYRIETADGERRWVRDYGRGIFDQNGELVDIEGIISDITDRKEIQQQLEVSERRYRTLAENFPNGAVGVYDDDLRYTLTRGAVLGDRLPSADRLEGARMPDVFPADTAGDLEPVFRAAVEEGVTDSVTTEFGGHVWRVWATPLRDGDGEIVSGMSFTQDVTEEVEREQKLEEVIEELAESNERLEQFAYAASHDLQEPLRMVSSYLRLIEDRYGDELDDDGEEFLEFAVDGAERMREMIDGLLEYSRVDTQGDPLEPVELDDVLENVLDNLQVKIEEHTAEITAVSLPRVRGDGSQLEQLLQNLLSNAIEYSGDEPPRIHVGAERDGWMWRISVHDDGVGIDSDDQERAFEVFQRLHSREERPGTGIGLALCQRIVERHGGEISVESEPGAGSTFSFTLVPPATDDG